MNEEHPVDINIIAPGLVDGSKQGSSNQGMLVAGCIGKEGNSCPGIRWLRLNSFRKKNQREENQQLSHK